MTSHLETLKVSQKKAFTSLKYKKGTFILSAFAILHQICGYGPIGYSSRALFRAIEKYNQTTITPDEEQAIISSILFVASIAGVFTVSRFYRRTLITQGYFFMTVLNLLIAIGMATYETNMTYVMMVAFLILY